MQKPFILSDNRFADATPTATNTAAGFDAAHIGDLRTHTSHRFASSGTRYYTVDCGSARSADTLAIVKHNLGTAAAAVSVESSPDNAVWTERLAPFTPTADTIICKQFTTASARYWRVKIVTASVAAEVAVLLLGARLDFPELLDGKTAVVIDEEKIQAEAMESETGSLLGVVTRFFPYEMRPTLSMLDPDWFRDTWRPWWNTHGKLLKPFVWVPSFDLHAGRYYFVRLQPTATCREAYRFGMIEKLELPLRGVDR